MAGDIQADLIRAVSVRSDRLFGIRRNIIQSCRRRRRRGITAAALSRIVNVNMASVFNRYRSFSRVFTLVSQGVYRPFTVILSDDRTIHYDSVCNFRCFIYCAGVVISVDIYSKVYRRGRSIYCGGRIEFYEFIIL